MNYYIMTPVTIILSIIIIVLVYVLYAYLTGTVTSLKPSASLKTLVPAITQIEGAQNTRYGYSLWVYVNTWTNDSPKTIFSRSENIKVYLDDTSPTLKVDLTMNDTASIDTMTVTENFPLQKWVSIAVSVDNQFVDVYLDGKLVKSKRFYKTTGTAPNTRGIFPKVPLDAASSPVVLGNISVATVATVATPASASAFTPFDAFVAEFKRWTVPIDPDSAWDNYLAGNGTNGVSRAFSSYGIDVAVLKNNVEQTRFTF
jgi:hypothetical protein